MHLAPTPYCHELGDMKYEELLSPNGSEPLAICAWHQHCIVTTSNYVLCAMSSCALSTTATWRRYLIVTNSNYVTRITLSCACPRSQTMRYVPCHCALPTAASRWLCALAPTSYCHELKLYDTNYVELCSLNGSEPTHTRSSAHAYTYTPK